MKRLGKRSGILLALGVSSLAVAAPFAYRVISGEGTPQDFRARVDRAFSAWGRIPGTSLQITPSDAANVSFAWGGDGVEFNPDARTRTIISEASPPKVEVFVNADTNDVDSALLVEAGLRLGVDVDAALTADKRNISEADQKAARAKFSNNGDLNGDGKVNLDDLEILAANYGKRSNAGGQPLTGDLNGDSSVDARDLEIMKGFYAFEDLSEAKPAEPPPAAPGTPPVPGKPPTPPLPAAPAPGAPATPPASPPAPTSPVANPEPPASPTPPPAQGDPGPSIPPEPPPPAK